MAGRIAIVVVSPANRGQASGQVDVIGIHGIHRDLVLQTHLGDGAETLNGGVIADLHEGLHLLLRQNLGGLEHLAGIGDGLLHHRDPPLLSFLLENLGLIGRIRFAGVEDQTHGLEGWIEGTGQIQFLAHRVGADRSHHIGLVLTHAPRRCAGTGSPGVGAVAKHHRQRGRGHLHGGLQRRSSHGQDHVDRFAHKLFGHQGGVGQLAGGILLDEVHGFARQVTRFCEGRFKPLAGEGGGRRIHHLQHADGGPLHLGGAEFAAGGEHQRAGGTQAHQPQKLTPLQGHRQPDPIKSSLWRSRRGPAIGLR